MRARAALILVLPLLCCSRVAAQESQSFVMERLTLVAGSETIASASYETTVTLGQESVAGASSFCNASLTDSLGFWSLLGDLPVPIVLTVAPNPTDAQAVVLSWSGNTPSFQVFRSSTPASIVSPGNLDQTVDVCNAADLSFGPLVALFYDVEAVPPTPAP